MNTLRAADGADNGQMLPLMEAFRTVQGEGQTHQSSVLLFRIGGCDVGCHWCDVQGILGCRQASINLLGCHVGHLGPNDKTIVILAESPLCGTHSESLTAAPQRCWEARSPRNLRRPATPRILGLGLSFPKKQGATPEWYVAAHELKVIVYNSGRPSLGPKECGSM